MKILEFLYYFQVKSEECVAALTNTEWDVHRAIKLVRLRLLLQTHLLSPNDNMCEILAQCDWDVQRAASFILATDAPNSDTTEV